MVEYAEEHLEPMLTFLWCRVGRDWGDTDDGLGVWLPLEVAGSAMGCLAVASTTVPHESELAVVVESRLVNSLFGRLELLLLTDVFCRTASEKPSVPLKVLALWLESPELLESTLVGR